MTKEIIELLENDVVFYDNEGSGKIAQIPRDDYDQALAKLRTEQPPASEFTKLARKAIVCLSLAEADEKGNIKDEKGVESSIEVLFRACDRLDASEARLKAMYSGDLSPESRLSGYKVITDQLRQQRDTSEASRKELLKFIWKQNPKHRHDHDYFHDDCTLCGMEKLRYEEIKAAIEKNKEGE